MAEITNHAEYYKSPKALESTEYEIKHGSFGKQTTRRTAETVAVIRRSTYEESCNLEVVKENATDKHNTELKNEDSYVVCLYPNYDH